MQNKTSLAQSGVDLFNLALENLALHRRDSANEDERKGIKILGQTQGFRHAATNWRKVAKHATQEEDYWSDLVHETCVEKAVEHLYDAETDSWTSKQVAIRVNTENIVNEGRMRECFRLKLLQPNDTDWPELFEWVDMRKKSIEYILPHVGRATACRIRTKLGLGFRNIRQPVILSLDELLGVVHKRGQEFVEEVLVEQCFDELSDSDLESFRSLVKKDYEHHALWVKPSVNFMGKRYKVDEEGDLLYKEDIVMQEVCKQLSGLYNKFEPRPPKQIDMLHVGMLQLVERPGSPYIGYESFIRGEYHKWNTNTGWKDESTFRHTPHAFSFATFRVTRGEMMVVDIQGVGDLYTDPQVHTLDGEGFGKGNLGARGMALFLRSFRFDQNPVVQYMQLTAFALAPGELCPPSTAEIEKFESGLAYLASKQWEKRMQRSDTANSVVETNQNIVEEASRITRSSSSRRRNSTIDDTISEVTTTSSSFADKLNEIPSFLLEVRNSYDLPECPKSMRDTIPLYESPEAAIHLALAKLYEENDDRVLEDIDQELFDLDYTIRFHKWMAALGGSVSAMVECGLDQGSSPVTSLAWFQLAAERGSRCACLQALSLVDPSDALLCIYYLQLALEVSDGKTDAERKLDMEKCSYELEAELGDAFLKLGETENASAHLSKAAELAMEAGQFKLYEQYLAKQSSI